MMFSIFRIHSYCVPVFFCVHFHCFGRPRIPAFLELWTAGLLDAGLLDAGLLECMHTVLEPGRELCASLLYSSTAYVHFNYFRALFAVYRTQYSGLSEKCLNVVGMHAHSAGTRQELCASLLCSSTASRGKVPKISTLCLHFYCFLLTILFSFSITFPLCIAFPYAFPMIVKPPSHIRMIKNLNPLQQPKK